MEIIADVGQNHNGDMGLAVKLIHVAKECGADVAKFQMYDARALFAPKEQNEWFDYNCKTELTREELQLLSHECEKAGIEFMASVFDVERIAWLEEVRVKRYKIASRSIHDRELIVALVKTRKPILVSLGFWDKKEFPKIESPAPVDFLYCISKYPTPPSDLKLSQVDFSRYAGFSDHTIGVIAAMAAMARGARVIEKHLTLDKKMYGPDHACSMTPDELQQLHQFRQELKKCL